MKPQTKAQPKSQIRIGTMPTMPGLFFIQLGDLQTFLTPRQAINLILILQSFIEITAKEASKDGDPE